MAQKLYCPACHKLLIDNWDLVIDNPIIMDIDKIKGSENDIKRITCHNCKRRIKYYIDNKNNGNCEAVSVDKCECTSN